MSNVNATVFTKNILVEIANVVSDLTGDLLKLEEYIICSEKTQKYVSDGVRVVQSIDRMLQEMNDLVRILNALSRQVGNDAGHERALLEAVLSLEKMKAKLMGAETGEATMENVGRAVFF